MALSGHGIVSGYSGGDKWEDGIISRYYEKVSRNQHYEGDWDFENNQHDLIFINLGTNDANYVNADRDNRKDEFVQEFAKHITNQPSLFDNIEISILSKLTYEVLRNIDTIISGEHSVKTLSNNIFNNSILDLSIKLQSSNINNIQEGTLTPDVIHRTLANYKEDLKKKNILEERCDG
jgi:hypothetical protein